MRWPNFSKLGDPTSDLTAGRRLAGALTVGSPSPLLSAPGWRPRHAEARVEGTTGEMRQWWRACGDEADGRPQSRGRLDLCSPQPSRPSAPCRGMFGWASIQAAWQACSAACCVIDVATAFVGTLVAECTSMAMASSGGPVVRGAAESMGAWRLHQHGDGFHGEGRPWCVGGGVHRHRHRQV